MYSDETVKTYKNLLDESKSELGIRDEPGTGAQRPKQAGVASWVKNLFKGSDEAAESGAKMYGVGRGGTSSRFTGKGTAGTNAGITNTERAANKSGQQAAQQTPEAANASLSGTQKAGLGFGGLGLGAVGYGAGRDMGFEEANEESETLRNIAFGSGMALGTSFPQIAEKGKEILSRVNDSPRRQRMIRGRRTQRY